MSQNVDLNGAKESGCCVSRCGVEDSQFRAKTRWLPGATYTEYLVAAVTFCDHQCQPLSPIRFTGKDDGLICLQCLRLYISA